MSCEDEFVPEFEGADGYLYVKLKNNQDVEVTMPVHMIVAKTFVRNPLKHKFVKHIDANLKNNRADNLRWVFKDPRK